MKKRIVVVGAGLGGMAAAIRLSHAGHDVEIHEKNAVSGGKLQERRDQGFRWDLGPSLLTMPHVLRSLFEDSGEHLDDYLTLDPLPCTCRYFWDDGTVIDEDEAFWKQPEVARFLDYARGIYELSGEAYLNYPPTEFWRAFRPENILKLRHLPKVMTFRSLAQEIDRRFSDPKLRQLFHRFATYNGSSPYATPATFNIIPYVESHFGGWYVRGGMARLSEAVTRLAEKSGVRFHYGSAATSWNGTTVSFSDGAAVQADYLVCNADVIQAHQTFLQSTTPPGKARSLQKPDLSSSGYVLLLGVRKQFPQLNHHNIFFSSDYPAEFDSIYRRRELPAQPTIYISITSRTDPVDAPSGEDNFFILVNSPALPPGAPLTGNYPDVIIDRLETMGLRGLRESITTREVFTAHDFAKRDGSWHGSLYGWASHSIRTALFRPPLRSPHDRRVFFTGGTTHPGGGIPLVLLSGKMVSDLIEQES